MGRGGVKVHPDGEEHAIKLKKGLSLTGTVRDETTGKLIPEFRIICGVPGRGSQAVPSWGSRESSWLKFSGGTFRHSFEEPVGQEGDDSQLIFKFEADGYLPSQSRVVEVDEGEARLDVGLKPGRVMLVTVLTSDGARASGIEIGLVTPGAGLRLGSDGFSKNAGTSGEVLLKADKEGRFQFTSDDAMREVVAAGAQGYAAVSPQSLVEDPRIELQPWGRLEVSLQRGGKPISGREYMLQFPDDQHGEIRFDFQTFQRSSDSNGHLLYPRVPPGKLKLVHVLVETEPNGLKSGTYAGKTDLEIRPGETTRISLGGTGYSIRGHISFLPDKAISKWKLDASVHPPYPKPPPDTAHNEKALAAFTKTPEFQEILQATRRFPVDISEDGTFLSDDVPGGTYVMTVNLRSSGHVVAHAEVSLTVPEEPVNGLLEVGEIFVQPDLPEK
jgi:hypothetical protein